MVWLLGAALLLGVVGLLIITGFTFSRLKTSQRKKSKFNYGGQQQQKIAELLAQALPVHQSSGWSLEGTQDGIRVFTRQVDSLQQYSTKQVFAASLIVDISLKRALSLVSSVRELPSWFFGLPCSNCSPPSLVQPSSTNSHVIQFTMATPQPQGTLQTLRSKLVGLPVLGGLVTTPSKIETETVERSWHLQSDNFGHLFTQPRFPTRLPYLWTCTFLSSLKQPGLCLATMIMSPVPGGVVSPLITGQLCSLREHITMRNFKVYSRYQLKSGQLKLGSEDGGRKGGGGGDDGERRGGEEMASMRRSSDISRGGEEMASMRRSSDIPEPLKEASTSSFQSSDASYQLEAPVVSAAHQDLTVGGPPPSSEAPPLSPEEVLNKSYLSMAKECTEKLVTMAKEGLEDGWLDLGTTKNVHVMKKAPAANEAPLNSVKGTGVVDAPPEFLLRLLQDPAHTTTLDDMLKETRVVEQLSPAVSLVQLLYKGVWPTSPRDLAVLSVAGQVNDSTWVSSASSIEDTRIPLEKGFVRADLLGGGYVIHSVPNKLEKSVVTYAACVNLKGSIPAFVVNKIAESQPMCVNNLRKLAEPLYKKMMADPRAMTEFESKFPLSKAFEDEPDQVSTSQAAEGDSKTNEVAPTMLQDRLAQSQWHFDPSSPPVPNEKQFLSAGKDESDRHQTGTSEDDKRANDVHHRFQTPPIDSDPEQEKSASRVGSETRTAPLDPSPNVAMDTAHDYERQSSVSLTPSSPTNETQSISSRAPSIPTHDPQRTGSVVSNHAALQLSQYTPSNGHLPEQSDNHLQSITRVNLNYPRHDSGQVDYRTLANQTAARVLEEVFHVSSLDLLDSSTFTDALTGGWSFAGFEKEVLLLSKSTPDQPFSSFMGKGIIPLSPQYIFNSLRNPQLRFMYDNMLKELHIVRHIEEGLFILHLHHETTQCFIKQARDFCILVSERSEPNKKLLTGFSIETPDCPPNQNIHRGKVHCSGWVVEPKQVKGKLCSQVTYLLQVDFGGVPSALVNLISKRQPLAVAYLRDYLVSTSLDQSGQFVQN